MIRILLAFVAGVWLFQFQSRIPDTDLFGIYLLLGLCAIPLRWLRLPVWLVLGFAWAHGHALLTRPPSLPQIDLTRLVWASGRVDSLVDREAGRSRFVLATTRLEQDGRSFAGDWRLQVSWYRDAPVLQPGQSWRLRLRLRPVWGYSNPGGFDYARWLYQQGITHTASVRSDPDNQRLTAASGAWLLRVRQHLSAAIAAQDAGAPASSLLRALVVGDRRGFQRDHWQAFTATGTNHLVAISGLHVGLVAGLVAALAGWLWRRLPGCCARWPAIQIGVVSGGLAALGYAALAGFAIPTQRALLMLMVAGAALLGGRTRQPGVILAVALALVVAWSPMAVMNAGLWLSFAAVGVILWVLLPGQPSSTARHWLRLQLAMGMALLPLLLLFFGQASLIAPLVNLLAIPWFSLLLVPLALLATLLWLVWPGVGEFAWQGWLWLGRWTLSVLQAVAEWDWVTVSWAVPQPALVGLAGIGALLLLAPRGVPARWLGLLLVLPLLTRQPERPAPGAFELTLLDVGQGLALVVRTAGHLLVYDAGPRFRSGFDTGSVVVVPFLRQLGADEIDTLVISHGDSDHAGGASAVREGLPVGRLLSGEPADVSGAEYCAAGDGWQWDGVKFALLSPLPDGQVQGNNASCVLLISNDHASLLLTGDMEAEVEQRLLTAGQLGHTDVVVAPHHGSLSSSTGDFVRLLSARHVLYATGRGNRWGFPRPEVVARWREQGATGWDTARDGAVRVHFPANQGSLRVYTHRRRHYWQP